ncbi:MAG: Calx-beta domain-containing protein [Marinicella sp.]|nr:hypothetical protein [Xanthomonadales bacterium]
MKHFGYWVLSLLLMLWTVSGNTWWLFVPQEGMQTQGVYADHNQGIMHNYNGQQIEYQSFDFGAYLPFTLSDQTGVQAFALEPVTDHFALWVSFSTPVAGFLAGDVVRCEQGSCELRFSPRNDLLQSANVQVDALGVNAFGGALVSFNVGFEYNGEYINPQDLYSVGFNSGNLVLTLQTDVTGFGVGDNANFTAYSKSYNGQSFDSYWGFDLPYARPLDFFYANEMQQTNSANLNGYFAFGLSELIQEITAFHSLSSGQVGFNNSSVSVFEDVGQINVPLYRSNGFEGWMQVVVTVYAGGTAVENVDFEFVNTQAAWLDDESVIKNIVINITDDNQFTGDRNFFLSVSADSQFADVWPLGNLTQVIILEDDSDDLIFKDGFE